MDVHIWQSAARRHRRVEWFDDLRQDLRLAVRTLVRSPGFTGAAVLVLAFGIGLAVAMFTVFNAGLRRPLPMREQERVVALWWEAEGNPRKMPLTYGTFERLREEAGTLDDIAGTMGDRAWPLAVREGGRALLLDVAPVTGNFFRMLGSQPFLGRMLRPQDDVVGASPVMVISHALWRRHFGGAPDAIGRRLTLHQRGLTYTVVGVAPPGPDYLPMGKFGIARSLPCDYILSYVVSTEWRMEETAGIRDLKVRLSSYLRRVKKGGTVLITERGKPVARIVPVKESPEDRLAALQQAGLLDWNGHHLGRVQPVTRVSRKQDVATLLIEDRD